MFRDMRPRSRALIAATTLALIAAPLTFTQTAQANPGGTGLVISEVYGGGGNTGAPLNNDFIELYNPTNAAIDVSGWSVQYRSATGDTAQLTNLSGSVPAQGHYLVQEGAGSSVTNKPLQDPDATGSIAMSGSNGVVLLVANRTPFTAQGDLAGNAGLVDMVGYGTTPTSFETARTGVALTNSTSASRGATGADTDHNANDFDEGAPAPVNSAGETPPVDPPVDPPAAVDKTIAEIQGTGDVSPLLGQNVRTTGVVTASYPTGGLNGFSLQTGGSGSGTDATPDASDGLFVYGGPGGFSSYPTVGDSVQVVGTVSEFGDATQITSTSANVTAVTPALAPVSPRTTVPGTECALPGDGCLTGAALDAAREKHESELFQPTSDYTVTDSYDGSPSPSTSSSFFGEIGLAANDASPLVTPTEIIDAQAGPEIAARTAYNDAHRIILDDGSSTSYTSVTDKPFPWFTADHTVRVGAAVSFPAPVVLSQSFGSWKILPQSQVVGKPTGQVTFEQTRSAAPEEVGGDLKLATFNVLNYFTTLGVDVAGCSSYTDRAGDPVTVRSCPGNGPRGAWDATNLKRQQDKIVTAVNKLDADIVTLEEIENSLAVDGADRDEAVSTLVDALNTAAGSTRWAFVPSPDTLPSGEDVIRTAFIYDPATTALVGDPQILVGATAFDNAREPSAQAFKATGSPDADGFAVIANHFKSKGSGTPDPDGQGNANDSRMAQAHALVTFADDFAASRGTEKVYLTGDFNAYSEEDPVQILEDAGYTSLESTSDADEESYSFGGMVGSLDHVFANEAAKPDVTGVDIWTINANESVYYEYSRFNYNATNLYDAGPFRSSDHNPEIVGIKVADPNAPKQLQLLGVNDFHGRINANTVRWAGTLEKLTADAGATPTLLVGAGDLIGASEFASAVDDDQPTIDVLNALGLDASAVGNHEFDQGWADLRDDVIGPEGARNAQWDYLGANVYAQGTTDPVLPEYALFDMNGVDVAVVGAVTQETGSLVSPGGIADIEFGNPVTAVNRVAGELSDGDPANGEADVIVASFHAGADKGTATSDYATEVAKGGEFAQMASLDADVDVIFNGHTHQVYAWDAPVPGQPGRTRPIVQTGEYAANVGQVTITYDPVTGDVSAYTARNVARVSTPDSELVASYPRVARVKQIVDAALANAATVGNQAVGEVDKDVTRAYRTGSYVNGTWVATPGSGNEDRGAESSLGDLVANSLRDGLPEGIEADLGVVNPGGLRADLLYAGNTANNPANTDGVVTYAEANSVLPFVNNVWTVDLTGASLKEVLEQQWQTKDPEKPGDPDPARPFLALGLSDNVRVTHDASKPQGARITSVHVNGEKLDPARTYTVSTFSFLGTGGDNFRAFKQGRSQDTGLVDRDLWIKYLRDNKPADSDFARQQVEATGMPSMVYAGQRVRFSLSKLDMTSLGAPQNTSLEITARSGRTTTELDPVTVTDGAATVDFTVPSHLTGAGEITFVAQPSGTTVTLPLGAQAATTVSAASDPFEYGTAGQVDVTVMPSDATGRVELRNGDSVVGAADLAEGEAHIALAARSLEPGTYRMSAAYGGDATHQASTSFVTVTVTKATATVDAVATPSTVQVKKGTSSIEVTVGATGFTPSGFVAAYVDGEYVTSAPLTDGRADLTVGPFDTVGDKVVELRYFGDEHTMTGSDTVTVTAQKGKPKG